jgi:hypothetical protein
MLNIRPRSFGSSQIAADGDLAKVAGSALAAILDAGAEALLLEPWRVGRIIRGAHDLTIDELAAQAARRSRAGPPVDLNLAIALAQLRLALKSPQFRAAWTNWRNSAPVEPASTSVGALCE